MMGWLRNRLGNACNRAGATLANGGWLPDGTGVMPGGDTGGDIQAGDSYSVRFVHPAHPGAIITVTFYPVEYDEAPGEFVVQRQIEWVVGADPADPIGSAYWTDTTYDDPFPGAFSLALAAEVDARFAAEDALGQPWVYVWDGQPWRAA